MRIKRKLDKTPPKIDDKCNLLSIHRKSPRELIKKFIKLKVNEDIVKKNFEVVDKIENTHPKVESWTNVKKLHQLVKAKKDRIYNKTVINKTLTLMKNKIDKNEKKFQKEKRKHYKSDL